MTNPVATDHSVWTALVSYPPTIPVALTLVTVILFGIDSFSNAIGETIKLRCEIHNNVKVRVGIIYMSAH
jgi:hypothetical protein